MGIEMNLGSSDNQAHSVNDVFSKISLSVY